MIDTDQLIKYLKNNYPVLGRIKTIKILEHNDINSINYFVDSDNGQFVLRNFIDGSSADKITKICKILDFCISNNAKASKPIKNKKNRYVDKKFKFYLTRYYYGKPYNGTTIQLKNAAKDIAILHKTLEKIKIKYPYKTDINRYYRAITITELNQIKDLINKKLHKDNFDSQLKHDMTFLLRCCYNFNRITNEANQLKYKTQLIHRDIHPKNIIFEKNNVAAIIDFNGMRKSKLIEDLAFSSFRLAAHKTKNSKLVKKNIKLFIDTYTKYNHIDENELFYLKYFFIREMLSKLGYILRKKYFLSSNLWDIDYKMITDYLKLAEKLA